VTSLVIGRHCRFAICDLRFQISNKREGSLPPRPFDWPRLVSATTLDSSEDRNVRRPVWAEVIFIRGRAKSWAKKFRASREK
jgi:hypothetical protein